MDMQVTLRAVNIFLYLPVIFESLYNFKHFISLVSVRHIVLFCIFIDKHAYTFYQGCTLLIRN
jgi:hypothetical protein